MFSNSAFFTENLIVFKVTEHVNEYEMEEVSAYLSATHINSWKLKQYKCKFTALKLTEPIENSRDHNTEVRRATL
jgi:hypothetical protein